MNCSPGNMFAICAADGLGIDDEEDLPIVDWPPEARPLNLSPPEDRPEGVRGSSRPGEFGADDLWCFGDRKSIWVAESRAPNPPEVASLLFRPIPCDALGTVFDTPTPPFVPYASAVSITSVGANISGRDDRDFCAGRSIKEGTGFAPGGNPRFRGLSTSASPPVRDSQLGATRTKFSPCTPSAGESAIEGRAGHSARSSARRDLRASPGIAVRITIPNNQSAKRSSRDSSPDYAAPLRR